MPTAMSSSRTPLVLSMAMLWLAGMSLRVTVLALPAVLNQVVKALGLNGGAVGVLTAIPSFCFAVGAIPGALLIRRVGASKALLAGLVLNAGGAVARSSITGMVGLSLATGGMALGISLMQGAMPSLVRQWLGGRVGLATSIYTFGLLVGEIAPMAGPFPFSARLVGARWRMQLALWALPVVLTFAVVVLFGRRTAAASPGGERLWPDWSTPALWQTGLLIGAVNATYFGLNGFLPLWLARAGHGDQVSAILFALNLAQLPAAFLMMATAERLVGRWWVYAAASLALLVSVLSLALAPSGAPFIAASVAGFCLALLLALALTVPPLVGTEPDLPQLTAGAFTLGYGLAVAAALATGWLDEFAPGVAGAAPIALASIGVTAIGWSIGRSIGSSRQARRHSRDRFRS